MKKNSKKINKKPSTTLKKDYKFTNDIKIGKEIKVNYPLPLMEFLLRNYKQFSRNNIKALLARKQILVNDIPTSKFDYQLVIGDIVSISKTSSAKGAPSIKDKIKIIYEDEDLIVINKQAGLLSIATDKEKEDTAFIVKAEEIFGDILTRENQFCHLTSSAFVINKEHTKVLCIYHNIYKSWSWVGGHGDGDEGCLYINF